MEDPVLSRRSVRKYTDEPVNDDTVERLLRAAMAARSRRSTTSSFTGSSVYLRMLRRLRTGSSMLPLRVTRVRYGGYRPGAGAATRSGRAAPGLTLRLSLIHISEPTRLGMISYAVFCLKKKK